MKTLWAAIFLGLVTVALAENFKNCPVEQQKCSTSNCKLPDCACSGTVPDLPLSERPQIVYLTFDDAATALASSQFYEGLFDGTFTNPNGCAIRATHFLTARANDYTLVHKYWTMGHEMASHSITHRSNTTYWRILSTLAWEQEIDGMRQMISKFGDIPYDDIRGMRSPYLQGGGDEMFQMLQNKGFSYDCTQPSQTFGYMNMKWGRWPYTNDHQNDMDCQIEPCPNCSFPGIWTQPMLDLEDNRIGQDPTHPDQGYPCAMLDSCIIPENQNPDDVYDMLKRNFERAYTGTTKAPFGLYMHAAWFFGNEWRYIGYKRFVEYLTTLNDVWIVPVWDGIQYFQDPVSNDELVAGNFTPFNCDNLPKPDTCFPHSCKYEVHNDDIDVSDYRMAICGTVCPSNFPWLGNPLGD